MDDADYATLAEEQAWKDLERRIAAARGERNRYAGVRFRHCRQCGEVLASHREALGTCLECHERLEHEAKLRAGRMGVGGL